MQQQQLRTCSTHYTHPHVIITLHKLTSGTPDAIRTRPGVFHSGGERVKKRYKEADPFYHSGPWLAVRDERLRMDNYICTDCMGRYLVTGEKPRDATMVHHVIPRTERPDLELDIDNLRSLCDICHNRKHPEKGGRGKAAPKKQPTRMRVIKI